MEIRSSLSRLISGLGWFNLMGPARYRREAPKKVGMNLRKKFGKKLRTTVKWSKLPLLIKIF